MKIIDHLYSDTDAYSVATIGFFDGVHSGHRFLIGHVRREARINGFSSMLITFADHPRQVMNPDFNLQLLTTNNEKLELLRHTGVDKVVTLNFTPEMATLSARQFMEDILFCKCGVRQLLIGHDHRFGRGRSEGFEDYCRYGEEMGMQIIQTDAYQQDEVQISSSFIRQCLHAGDILNANRALGYAYYLDGTVTGGYQLGRKMGYPTANLTVDHPYKLIPADGVYATCVTLADGQRYVGMLNIGRRPTVGNDSQRTIEVHLLDFSGNLYNQHLRIEFISFIRPEIKFPSIAELIAQLAHDEVEVRKSVILRTDSNIDRLETL